MKSLNIYIKEGLRLSIDDKPELCPTTWEELRQIIEDRFKEFGPGTEQKPINFNDIDVSGMTTFYNEDNFNGVFADMAYEYIDVFKWDISNVGDMNNMFYGCETLKSVGDLSNWDISSVYAMSQMFDNSGIINTPSWYEG